MRFQSYRGARPGIASLVEAVTAPGGSTYNETMRQLAHVDSARASARHSDSETALNQQTLDAGQRMMAPEMQKSLADLMPQGVDPSLYSAGWMASKDRSFDHFTRGVQNLTGGIASQAAHAAAAAGDTDLMNRMNTVAKPGEEYTPFAMSDAGVIDKGTGAYTVSDLARAREHQANASAAASNAHAGLYDAQRRAAGFIEVSPGTSVYQVGQQSAAAAPGVVGHLPGGRPVVQNPDGSVSTHRMATVTDPRINDGRATNIPTMIGGETLGSMQALEQIAAGGGVDPDTGQPLRSFDSIADAETDYLLRQHPQIDREASHIQRQHQAAAPGVADVLRRVVTAPGIPSSDKPTNAAKTYGELVALGVPEHIARGTAYKTIRQVEDDRGNMTLVDVVSGTVIGQLKTDLRTGTVIWQPLGGAAGPAPGVGAGNDPLGIR